MNYYLKNTVNKSWSEVFISFLVGFAFFISIPIFTLFYFAHDVSSKANIVSKKDRGIVLYDRNDQPFFTFYQGKTKDFVTLSEVPDHVKHAVIAIEDKEFYHHDGYSIRGIARSFFSNVKSGEVVQGGSTITQQLVKNTLLNPRRDFLRKYQEIILSSKLESDYTKDELLEMYLNTSYLGEGAAGISAAANTYFNKEAKDLTLAESSLIAGILPAPSRLNPISGDAEEAKARQKLVLQKMVEQKYITQEQADEALNQELTFAKKDTSVNKIAPHFAIMVRDELVEEYGEEFLATSGYKIKTTLDLKMQEQAEKTIDEQVARLKVNRATNGAMVAMDPRSGEILALVGSRNWSDEEFGKVNIVLSPRQPGSSFKPIVYTAAFEKGLITPATVLKDEAITYDVKPIPYAPKNYDGRFRGNVLARFALANSLNVPAVEVMNKLGVDRALDMAERLGITTLSDRSRFGLSLALGAGEVKPIELVTAYGVFANQGYKNKPQTILEIKDKQDKVLYSFSPEPEKVLDPEYAYLISSVLSDNNARAETFGNKLTLSNRPAAVKTGTTQNYKDAWTIGYTPQLVVGVWVGNNDGRTMDNIAGSLGAAPIWKSLMEQFLKDQPVLAFEKPSSVLALSICKSNGLLTTQESSGSAYNEVASYAYTEYFISGTQPTASCPAPAPKPEDLAAQDPNQQPQPEQTPQPTPQTVVQVEVPVGGPPEHAENDKKREDENRD